MYSDITNQIRSLYNTFTGSERRVADFILDTHMRLLVNSTISDVAQKCGTSETSVFRFCKKIGLSGFHELKWQLLFGKTDGQPAPEAADEASVQRLNLITETATSMSAGYRQCIDNMLSMLRPQDVSDAVDLMVSARMIYFFGAGISMLSAMEAKNQFMNVTPNVNASTNLYTQQVEAGRLTPDDVAVFFSFSGATKAVLRIAETVAARQVPIILITRYAKSPLSSLSRYSFISDTNDTGVLSGTMVAPMSQLFLVDLLYNVYCSRTKLTSQTNHAAINKLVMEHLV